MLPNLIKFLLYGKFSHISKHYPVILIIFGLIGGCSNIEKLQSAYNPFFHKYSNMYFKPLPNLKEYINRVMERLLIVHDFTNRKYIKINLEITSENSPKIYVKSSSFDRLNKISLIKISTKTLDYLQDEAELAAVLAIILEKIYNNYNETLEIRIINHLWRAGYNPIAYLDLQNAYLKKFRLTNQWLKNILNQVTIEQIRNNYTYINQLPYQGVRNKLDYLNSVYLIDQ